MSIDKAALHDLTPEAAIEAGEKILEEMRADPDRNQLTGVDPDVAFELGYETALFDFRHSTGPSTQEVGIIFHGLPPKEAAADAAALEVSE